MTGEPNFSVQRNPNDQSTVYFISVASQMRGEWVVEAFRGLGKAIFKVLSYSR